MGRTSKTGSSAAGAHRAELVISVARVWRARERIEREAAALFSSIADELDACGEDPELVRMAREAGTDELDHAARCRAIVDELAPELEPLDVPPPTRLGPPTLGKHDRVLYETVAMGCVTESLSCGLLLAMRERATHPRIFDTIQHILRDEVRHSRVGWAHLAHAARQRDVSWLEPHIGPMVRAAMKSDVVPMCDDTEAPSFGVLTHAQSHAVVAETIREVVVPGFAAYAIRVDVG